MPKNLQLPFTKYQIQEIIKIYPTPFHIYDEKAIRTNARKLKQSFINAGFSNYHNYFAVKALPNPCIMQILAEEGMGFDCSSMAELLLCERIGQINKTFENGLPKIMYTSNETPWIEFQKCVEFGGIINFDDISHIEYFEKHLGNLPELICLRYNPGPRRTIGENNYIIGDPTEAKFGFTYQQLFDGYKILKEKGVTRFGLHTMIASNETNSDVFVETANMLAHLVSEIETQIGIKIEFINLGGGFGVNYKPEQEQLNFDNISQGISNVLRRRPELLVVTENGRVITGPYGYLITTAIHQKHTYKDYIGVDANMANLMRPGMYGSYHYITVIGKEKAERKYKYDVVGSLCENNDKFAIDRMLPEIEIDDILAIHDTGAHGHAMGFNYNGKLRSAELLLLENGEVKLIRRAENYNDLFATLN